MNDLDVPGDDFAADLDQGFDELFADGLAALPDADLPAADAPAAGQATTAPPVVPPGRLEMLKAMLRRIDADARAARRGSTAAAAPPRYLRCTIGGLPFALPLDTLAEVARVPSTVPVPHVRPWVLGLVNVRGHVLALVDLRVLLGWPAPAAPTDRVLVGRRRGGDPLGAFVVDGVQGIRAYEADRLRLSGPGAEAPHGIVGTGEDADGEVMLLDLERLMASAECARFDAA